MQPFYTDHAQGDVICTFCGVVQVESLLDTSPEWRDYADESTGNAKARCGMVPTDESRWVGGLEPTRLSAVPIGSHTHSSSSSSSHTIRQTLLRMQHRTDKFLQTRQKRAWEQAEVAVQIAQRKQQKKEASVDNAAATTPADITEPEEQQQQRPLFELVVEDTDDDEVNNLELAEQVRHLQVQRKQMFAEKWSLQRALLPQDESTDTAGIESMVRNKGAKKMTSKEKKIFERAAMQLREAYRALQKAAKSLPLSDLENAAVRLEKYAIQKDGLPKDCAALASALLGRKQLHVPRKHYQKAVKDLQKYNLFRATAIEDWIRPLQLPTTAEAVILYLVKSDTQQQSIQKDLAAALTYLVCAAGARSQHWAKAANTTTVAWDAWREELVWARKPETIAQAFDVSLAQVRQQYERRAFPERKILLTKASETATPLKTVLLPQLAAAAATLKLSEFGNSKT